MPKSVICRYFLALLLCLSAGTLFASNDSISYIPEIHGVVRGRWELETHEGYSHFQVRNARLSVQGKVGPVFSYFLNTDLCDRGKILFLDGYAAIDPFKGFNVKIGQYRMPFGIESFRGPGGYYFNNRSFIGKHVNNYRAVGVSVGYTLPQIPLSIEAGVFNPTVMDDQATWVKKYAYAGRLVYKPSGWVFATGFESLIPDSVRINLVSATVGWSCDRFYAEGEYMVRTYTHSTHQTTQAYNFFVNYGIPLKKSIFDTWSFQARFDGMTDLASGLLPVEADGRLATTAPGRKRLTIGSTLDYRYKILRAAIRLNYEKYWYDHSVKPSRGNGDMLTAELIVKF